MKNKLIIIILFTFFTIKYSYADDLFIEAKDITLDKNKQITIFKNEVSVTTKDKKISSQYAEFNKEKQEIFLKKNVIAQDKLKNIVKTNHAKYNNEKLIFETKGPTTLISSQNYTLEGANLFFDNKLKIIKSNKSSILRDLSGNKIYLENFEYLIKENIFKSIGLIKIVDQFENSYEFSQIYIDTKKKEILGTDIKAFINNEAFKYNKSNDPRIYSNTMKSNKEISTFEKSVFTFCKFREGEKCPPWTLQASKMTHDSKKKTIYYDNAVVKIYDIPIFYFPYLAHPDPSVDRRSGLLIPSFTNSKNLGNGMSIPYFFNLGADKNFTLNSRLYFDQHPLFVGEYHQAFKNSSFIADFGYTEGYKKTSSAKKAGDKSHLFFKFVKDFMGPSGSENSLVINSQNVSNKKYLKLYKIQSNLVNHNVDHLENSFSFSHSKDDLFFNISTNVFENLKDNVDDDYEFIVPKILLDKNLIRSKKFGNIDLETKFTSTNYDTNKKITQLINTFDLESNRYIFNSKIKNNFLAKIKNFNYDANNVEIYRDKKSSELFGAIGLLSEIDFMKRKNSTTHLLTPKLLLRFAPSEMRKQIDGSRLSVIDAFSMDRVDEEENFETGNTATLGLDFDIKKDNVDKFNFSVAQIINEKENKKFHSKTSLDEKLSDLVGEAAYNFNEKFSLNYEFSIDQNYSELNYNDFGANLKLQNLDIDFNYIEENKHIGDKQYFKTKVDYLKNEKSLFSFETKRNLISNSSEFYDLSYEYINDCLRAGLVYRREFYQDSEIEPENSLMFKITLVPFGNIDTPEINR